MAQSDGERVYNKDVERGNVYGETRSAHMRFVILINFKKLNLYNYIYIQIDESINI